MSLGLAAPLRDVVRQLVSDFGESALLVRTAIVDVPSTGAVTATPTSYTVKAARLSPKTSFAAALAEVLGNLFPSGSSVSSANEVAVLAAKGLAITLAEGDVLTWGTVDSPGSRRAVVSVKTERVEGQNVAYFLELKQ